MAARTWAGSPGGADRAGVWAPAALRVRRPGVRILLVTLWLLGTVSAAHGHASRETYVWLNVDETHLEGRFEIRVPDLRAGFGLDIPDEYEAARAKVIDTEETIQRYILERFEMTASGAPVPIEFTGTDLLRSDALGHFAQYHYRTPVFEIPDELLVRNELLFDRNVNRLLRGLVCMEYNRKTGKVYSTEMVDPAEGEKPKATTFTALVFAPDNTAQVLDLVDTRGLLSGRDFVREGLLVWTRLDHGLFLIAVLLPVVLVRGGEPEQWEPAPGFGRAVLRVIAIVALLTVASTITQGLATLGLVQIPPRFAASMMAFSVVLVAVNNCFPLFRDSTLLIIFFFALFHGIGFATILGHLPFRMTNLVKMAFAFNAGIGFGQVAIVAAVFPLAFAIRKTRPYQPVVLFAGSLVIAALASWSLVQGAFEP